MSSARTGPFRPPTHRGTCICCNCTRPLVADHPVCQRCLASGSYARLMRKRRREEHHHRMWGGWATALERTCIGAACVFELVLLGFWFDASAGTIAGAFGHVALAVLLAICLAVWVVWAMENPR